MAFYTSIHNNKKMGCGGPNLASAHSAPWSPIDGQSPEQCRPCCLEGYLTVAQCPHSTRGFHVPPHFVQEGHFLFNEIQSLANVGATCYTALEGTVTASKEVTLKDAAVLEGMGLTPGPGDITPLSPKAYHCSTEGV